MLSQNHNPKGRDVIYGRPKTFYVNFLIHILSWAQFHQRSTYSFYARRSRMRKNRQSSQHCHFTLLGSASVKVVRRTLMKSTPAISKLLIHSLSTAHRDLVTLQEIKQFLEMC
jgi:hypothetical protein